MTSTVVAKGFGEILTQSATKTKGIGKYDRDNSRDFNKGDFLQKTMNVCE